MKRVVSLVPSQTLSMFDLGRGDWVVGVTRYCEEPAEAVAALPKVGGTKNPNLEKIAELKPDLVLVNTEENRAEDIAWLRQRFPVHESMPRTVRQVVGVLQSLGKELGCEAAASRLTNEIENQLAGVGEDPDPVPVLYMIWKKPWMAVNRDTYIHDLLTVAGARNVTGALPDRYPTLEEDGLPGLAPELVLLPSEPFPFTDQHLQEVTSAGVFGPAAVTLVDGRDFCWHGSRTALGLARATRLLQEFRSRR